MSAARHDQISRSNVSFGAGTFHHFPCMTHRMNFSYPCSTRNVLLHAAGEQEDFRPLFLPGPPALVLG
jgi:hypothetical protein